MAKITCGIEIHQQLDTEKLFCRCPSVIREDEPLLNVVRKLRAVVGETGVIDVAAVAEMKKGKRFLYEGYRENTCLVDFDECPPEPLNDAALDVVLQVAKMVGAMVFDAVQVMRKTIVDGSNTGGFQRTGLVAVSGKMETSEGIVGIPTIIIEEDSARIIADSKDSTTFRLDRLSIPLIEISTSPDIHSPQHCLEVAEKLGMLLRSTGRVKRGLGTIRQDVNVSIEGGARVEIKGCQDLKLLPRIVEIEVQRQERLLEMKAELGRRKVSGIVLSVVDLSGLFSKSSSNVVKKALSAGGVVYGMKLAKFGGLLGKELQPNKRFGTELSDVAKVSAGVGGIFHSDELPNYGITADEVKQVQQKLGCGKDDAFVLVADVSSRAKIALDAVVSRAREAVLGVPKQVRRANDDGTSSYLRPMPGAARMYPETDIPIIRISPERLKRIPLPELIEDRIKRYEKLGLGRDLAPAIAKSEQSALFESLMKKCKNVKPAYIAETLVSYAAEILRTYKEADPFKITDDMLEKLFVALDHGDLAKESVKQVLADVALGKWFDLARYKLLSEKELKKALHQIVAKNKGKPVNALIGLAMAELRGKAEGKKIVELLQKLV